MSWRKFSNQHSLFSLQNFPLQMDPLSGMASLNLGGTATSHTQSMQGFPTSLSSAFSNPQSPAKAFPPLPNPNPSTPFGGIGSLSSQLPGMDSGTMLFYFFFIYDERGRPVLRENWWWCALHLGMHGGVKIGATTLHFRLVNELEHFE